MRPAEGRRSNAVAKCADTEVKVTGAKLEGTDPHGSGQDRTTSQWPIPSSPARPGCGAHLWPAAVPGPYCAGGRGPPTPRSRGRRPDPTAGGRGGCVVLGESLPLWISFLVAPGTSHDLVACNLMYSSSSGGQNFELSVLGLKLGELRAAHFRGGRSWSVLSLPLCSLEGPWRSHWGLPSSPEPLPCPIRTALRTHKRHSGG